MTCSQAPTPLAPPRPRIRSRGYLTSAVGGPADHKQTSLASYSSEVATTPWSSSVGAARGASFCQDGLGISNRPRVLGPVRGGGNKR